jgi:phage terminase large subunit-like protein
VRTSKNAPLYAEWERDGHLTVLPGAVQDHAVVIETLQQDAARFGCDSIGLDRLFQGLTVAQGLADAGLSVYPVGMGFLSMGPLVAELERLVLSGRLHHGGHPILRWAVDGVEMKTDPAGNRKPARDMRDRKIDALVAVLLALDRWLRHEPVAVVDPDYCPLQVWGNDD